uniref:Uncharacterized protein n=1 Tax=Triticum urartu TaxID=4572 RepID=A0A8R7UI14_TRIUA
RTIRQDPRIRSGAIHHHLPQSRPRGAAATKSTASRAPTRAEPARPPLSPSLPEAHQEPDLGMPSHGRRRPWPPSRTRSRPRSHHD